MTTDFYKILGVSKDVSQENIKKAYRKLARKYHPDINPGNKSAEEKFKNISEAYDCLGNQEKKALYDEFGHDGLQAGFDPEKARQYSQWEGFRQSEQRTKNEGFGRYQSYEDVFGDIFEAGTGASGFRSQSPAKGSDFQHDMSIDLVSALRGFETELSMQKAKTCNLCGGSGNDPNSTLSTCAYCGGSGRLNVAEGPMHFTKPCPHCQGHGQMGKPCTACGGSGEVTGSEKIKVTVPKGVKEGSKVRIAGKGKPGYNGGEPGDLYLIIHLKPHPFLERSGDDLYMDVPITVREAVAGGSIDIPTMDGPIKLKVPSGSQTGKVLRLKGKGATNLKTKKRGNLMVKLLVKVPQTEDPEILAAIQKMDGMYKEDVRSAIRL
jgi:molecular chaperone DnaJ